MRLAIITLVLLFICRPAANAEDLVFDLDAQPLRAQVKRLVSALDYVGQPLPEVSANILKELEASEVEPEILEDLINFYDDPIFDTSVIPTFMLSRLISKHCKVAIGGDGGDELFGGYPHYDKLLTIKYNSKFIPCLLYTSPSPRDLSTSRMPSSA